MPGLSRYPMPVRRSWSRVPPFFRREMAERTAGPSTSSSAISPIRSATEIQPPSRRTNSPQIVLIRELGRVGVSDMLAFLRWVST